MAFVSAAPVVSVVVTSPVPNGIAKAKCRFRPFVSVSIMALPRPKPCMALSESRSGSTSVRTWKTTHLARAVSVASAVIAPPVIAEGLEVRADAVVVALVARDVVQGVEHLTQQLRLPRLLPKKLRLPNKNRSSLHSFISTP